MNELNCPDGPASGDSKPPPSSVAASTRSSDTASISEERSPPGLLIPTKPIVRAPAPSCSSSSTSSYAAPPGLTRATSTPSTVTAKSWPGESRAFIRAAARKLSRYTPVSGTCTERENRPVRCRKATWSPSGAAGLPDVKPDPLDVTPESPRNVQGVPDGR